MNFMQDFSKESRRNAEELRACLSLIVDCIDYIGDGKSRSCSATEMVGAVLPQDVLLRAKAVLDKVHGWDSQPSGVRR